MERLDMVTRERLDELYETILDMAGHLLRNAGEFFPICSVIRPDGEVAHLAIFDGDEHPESVKMIDDLQNVLRKQAAAGEILASALAIDIRARKSAEEKPVDAVCVRLRAADFCRDAIVPYGIATSGLFRKQRIVTFGEAWAHAAEQDIFV